MVRQYRIHTDLDGSNNKIYDMNTGLIRFYQPSDLGIINSTNIWQSQGIGVMGNNNISHPDIDFKFETFGNSLEENYRIFNEFINSIIKQKYITLEYTNEIGTFYADIQLSKITKTEGYGFDGQFSETISFIPVNMWYVYEQLKFSKVQNGEIGGNTKIYANKETTVYPNLNLLDGSSSTLKTISAKGWGYNYVDQKPNTLNLIKGQTLTYNIWIQDCDIDTRGVVYLYDSQNKQYNNFGNIIKAGTSGFSTVTFTVGIDVAKHTVAIGFLSNQSDSHNLSYSNIKLEQGSTATPWIQSESEVKTSDYPNYIGTYSDSSIESSSDYKKYQWAIFRGQNSNAYTSYSWSSDRFTTTYPNLNLLSNSKFPDDKLTSPWGNYANGGTVVISNGEYNYTTPSTGSASGKQGGLNYSDTSIMTTQKSYVWSAKVKGSGSVRITYQYTYTDGTTSSWIQGGDTTLSPDYALAKAIIPPQTKAFTKVVLTLYFQGASTGSIKEPKLEEGSIVTPWMPSESEVTPSDYRNHGSYKYDYTYFGEDNIERFSKWKIDDGIFSFTARMTPSQNLENMSNYGVRFLDEQFNEYTALIFGNTTKPDSLQFNTDVNDEYYQAQIGTSTINMFSALNYQRFRTRFIQKGTMELVNVDVVEMNVKRKVEFV